MTTSGQSSKVLFTCTDHRYLQESVNVPSISPISQLQKLRHRRSDCPGMISSVSGGRVLVTYPSMRLVRQEEGASDCLQSHSLPAAGCTSFLGPRGPFRCCSVVLGITQVSQFLRHHGGDRVGGGLEVPQFWSYPLWQLFLAFPHFGES